MKNLTLFDSLISQFPQIERKGKTTPFTSHNGYMFSFLDKEGKLGLRLSDEEKEKIISAYSSKLMEQHGRVMKDFVEIPQEVLEDENLMKELIQASYDYTSSLKPKKK